MLPAFPKPHHISIQASFYNQEPKKKSKTKRFLSANSWQQRWRRIETLMHVLISQFSAPKGAITTIVVYCFTMLAYFGPVFISAHALYTGIFPSDESGNGPATRRVARCSLCACASLLRWWSNNATNPDDCY